MNDDTQALSVDELVEYCRTQAGLLSGHVETMSVETNDLLDEIDEDIAEIRTHLEERANSTEGPTASPTTTGPNDPQHNFTELEELETELKEKCVLQTALGRAKRPEEVGKVAVFLASDLASYVTGESLVVNGGFISTNL